MGQYRPSFVEADQPDTSATRVRTPSGRDLDVIDPALAAELGEGVRVIKQSVGIFDTMPLSLISTQTIQALGALAGLELDPLRFRPNLLIDVTQDASFPEDAWVGSVLRIGGLRMRADQRDQRCVMINVDPASSTIDPTVLKTVARERDSRLGVYGSTVEPGRVAVGDPVFVEA